MLRFKATRAGVFVYHCAPGGPMTPVHVVSGMNGAIMVLPRDGLKDGEGKPLHYDRVYYIGEQDFYVPRDEKGNFKSFTDLADAMPETLDVMQKLIPTHVVFNGKVGALTGKNALKAKVGETVLIIHSQANRDSRPHLIGGHGDYVWETGKFANPPQVDQETWFIRGGSAGAALYTFRQPGLYAYVTHNLIEAVMLGATAHFKVEGKWNDDLMKQIEAPGPIPAAEDQLISCERGLAMVYRLKLAAKAALFAASLATAAFASPRATSAISPRPSRSAKQPSPTGSRATSRRTAAASTRRKKRGRSPPSTS